MPMMNGVWRVICRIIAPSRAPRTISLGTEWAGFVRWWRSFVDARRTGGRRLRQFRMQLREQLREQQRHSQLAWQEAIREDRRAKRRALTLLLRLLDAQQRQDFRQSGHFFVTGGSSGQRYRIRADRIANIDVLRDDGTMKCRLCVLPAGGVPVYDVMAAQMLHLQDPDTELRLLKQANVFPLEKTAFSRSVWVA